MHLSSELGEIIAVRGLVEPNSASLYWYHDSDRPFKQIFLPEENSRTTRNNADVLDEEDRDFSELTAKISTEIQLCHR